MFTKHIQLVGEAIVATWGRAINIFFEGIGKFAVNVGPAITPDFDIDGKKYVEHIGIGQ